MFISCMETSLLRLILSFSFLPSAVMSAAVPFSPTSTLIASMIFCCSFTAFTCCTLLIPGIFILQLDNDWLISSENAFKVHESTLAIFCSCSAYLSACFFCSRSDSLSLIRSKKPGFSSPPVAEDRFLRWTTSTCGLVIIRGEVDATVELFHPKQEAEEVEEEESAAITLLCLAELTRVVRAITDAILRQLSVSHFLSVGVVLE
mmetsp:Transcript_18183/g.27176  ORF Transcript_18183/g.27176 Transcript_18183/m.27176 type:complete len:204 (-) Transcript_18183:20-631(-)